MKSVTRFGLGLAAAVTASCGASAGHRAALHTPAARWTPVAHLRGVFDLSPGTGGRILVAGRGHLASLSGGKLAAFAPAYTAPPGLESYIAVAGPQAGEAACRFQAGTAYALHVRGTPSITAVSATGHARVFARLPSAGFENGIAFDTSGLFGRRLLVTATRHGHTSVYAIDCRGRVRTITRTAPPVEGGIAVAPAGFGRFGGELIAPDEHSGNLYAVSAAGKSTLLARSGLPHGGDIGVESLGFVPTRFGAALVADRGTPGNPHPGDNVILRAPRSVLAAAGVRSGDLLAVAEASALSIAVRCTTTCAVRTIAIGPRRAHIEGHVIFAGR